MTETERLVDCPRCNGIVSFHADKECNGCHLIECKACEIFFDCHAVDTVNDSDTLEELRAKIAAYWNRRDESRRATQKDDYPYWHCPIHGEVIGTCCRLAQPPREAAPAQGAPKPVNWIQSEPPLEPAPVAQDAELIAGLRHWADKYCDDYFMQKCFNESADRIAALTAERDRYNTMWSGMVGCADAAQKRAESAEAALKQRAQEPTLLPLNEHVRYILGRPCFTLISIADTLRRAGTVIDKRAEDEQATVIHWLLSKYLEHGDEWRKAADAELNAIDKATLPAAPKSDTAEGGR